MESACKQQGCHKENGNNKNKQIYAQNQEETVEIPCTHEESRLGNLNAHGVY